MSHTPPTLTIETMFPAISKKSSSIVALIKVAHPAMAEIKSARTRLNIVFAIDISGSMSSRLQNSAPLPPPLNLFARPSVPPTFGTPAPTPVPGTPWPMPGADPLGPWLGVRAQDVPLQNGPQQMLGAIYFQPQLQQLVQQLQYCSKLDRVKSAAINAIQQLSADDRFGVVSFDSYVSTVVESTLATPQAKADAIASITALKTGSSTALHAGWKGAAEMVCKNLDAKMVNRVLLLTDGEATDGIKDTQTLSKHASTMAEHGVTTSTFGVGDQYNETLLQKMAESGDGRYYYLEGDSNFERLFAEEFQGMSRLYGSDVRLRVHATSATLELYNDLPVTPQGWKLPNAVHEKVEYYLVTLKPNKVISDSIDFLVAYDYKHDGVVNTVSIEHTIGVVSEKSFSSMKENDMVGKKKLELETARAKEKAMAALDRGDYNMSKSILSASASTISCSAYATAPEFMAQSARLETLINVGDTGDHQKLRKMSTHDTYSTRNNFADPKK